MLIVNNDIEDLKNKNENVSMFHIQNEGSWISWHYPRYQS